MRKKGRELEKYIYIFIIFLMPKATWGQRKRGGNGKCVRKKGRSELKGELKVWEKGGREQKV